MTPVNPRILYLEDDPKDVELVRAHLATSGFPAALIWAKSRQEYEKLLEDPTIDLVLADYRIPAYDGSAALRRCRELRPSLPFIFYSGALDEDAAVRAIADGATDYVLKTTPRRLAASVRRACTEAWLYHEQQRTDELFRLLVENIREVFWVTDDEKKQMLYVSPGYEAIWGRSVASLQEDARQWLNAIHPEDRQRIVDAALTKQTSGLYNEKYRIVRPDGSVRWIRDKAFPVVTRYGARVCGIAEDITDLIEAMNAAKVNESRFSAIFRSAPIPIAIEELWTGRIIAVNQEFSHFFGRISGEIVGRTVDELNLYEDATFRKELMKTLETEGTVRNIEVRFRQKSGEIREGIVSWDLVQIPGDPSPLLVKMIVDIGERKRLENQFREVQKMEAVGQLAGGVAHDFNNLLTTIIGLTDLMAPGLARNEEAARDLADIRETAMRAAKLTHQLLAFSRRQVFELKNVDLNVLVSDMRNMLSRVIRENIELHVHLPDAPTIARVDPVRIEQILLNLAVNARDAMPADGKLTIAVSAECASEEDLAANPGLKSRDVACLTVTDTGEGMTEEVRRHVFEPFFTTKGPGKGTGLGLAVCYGIVKQHGGHIAVKTEPGKGATFRIYLPLAEAPADKPAPARAEASPDRGNETILVVEDEEQVRRLLSRALSEHGYNVLTAENGEEALEIIDADKAKRIRLVVSDAVMPRMGGADLARFVQRRRPDVKILFMSGHMDENILKDSIPRFNFNFIAKPFTVDQVARKVRDILDNPSRRPLI